MLAEFKVLNFLNFLMNPPLEIILIHLFNLFKVVCDIWEWYLQSVSKFQINAQKP